MYRTLRLILPPWRLWQAPDHDHDNHGKNQLANIRSVQRMAVLSSGYTHSNRHPPCRIALYERETVVDPVGQHYTHSNEPDLPADESTPVIRLAQLGLIHGHSARVNSGTKAYFEISTILIEYAQCSCSPVIIRPTIR